MKHRRLRMAGAILCATAILGACSRDGPFAPGVHSISGHVKLRGYYLDARGNFAGTRIIGDATGVPVDLLYGDEVLATTTSEKGSYRFDGIGPGGYHVRARVIPGIEWRTDPLIVARRDVTAADTLQLESLGDLVPVPNPFADTMTVYFDVPDSTVARLALLDIGGRPVRTFFDHVLAPSLYTYPIRLPSLPAESGPILYWLTYSAGEDVRAQLLVREQGAGAVFVRAGAQ